MTAETAIPETLFDRDTVEIIGPRGRLGSIRPLDAWQGRLSPLHAKTLIAKVATISYGREASSNPVTLFDRLLNAKPVPHGEPLEMVPFPSEDWNKGGSPAWRPLRGASLRHCLDALDCPEEWGEEVVEEERKGHPCHLFLIEMPLYLRAQLFRHETFPHLTECNIAPEQGQAKNEMSRRFTKDQTVPFTFANDDSDQDESPISDLHAACVREYYRRIDAGWKPEDARGIIPQEAMTRFWWGGYDRDILAGPKVQRADAHAQEGLRIFVQWIADYLEEVSP
jgi:Thymidylate synthase complementing protein